jgi:parallel beta-helix repeat protein
MKKFTFLLIAFLMAGGFLSAQHITFNTVPPLVGGTSTAGGNVFNITTNKRILLDSVRGSFSTVSGTVTLWYNPVRVNGTPAPISVATGWINLGSAPMTGLSATTTSAATLQTIPVGFGGLMLNPGDTIAVAIQWTGNVFTTNNTSIPTFTDGTVTFVLDASSAFTMNAGMTSFFNPRQLNGGIVYRILSGSPNDAAVTHLVSPVNFPAGLNNVSVRVANRGSNTITSLNVMWELDDTLQTTFSWTGVLDTLGGSLGPNDTVLTIGSINVPVNTTRKLKIWTSMPNGVADTANGNDTITRFISPSMSGVYTVGRVTSDFSTLQQAFTALSSLGVAGPVTLEVDSALSGNVAIATIPGVSATNTVLVRGKGHTITSTVQPVLALNGAQRVSFDSLNVLLTSATGFGYHITGQSRFIAIRNSTINVGTTSTLTSNGGIVASGSQTVITTTGSNANNVTIENNTIIGGYYGVSLVGSGSYLGSTNHIVRNNTFLDNYFGGVYLNSTDTVLVEGNNISRATRSTISTYYGIYGTTTRNSKVIGNRIHNTGSGSYTCYPIWFATSINSVGFETEIINNMMWNFPTTSTLHGIHLTISTTGFKIYHNTILLNLATGSTGTVRGINFGVAANATDFRNNIISITGNGTGVKSNIHITTASPTLTSNRNVLHMAATGGTNNIGFSTANQTTLLNWQTATSQDANSVAADPFFEDPTIGNLTPISSVVDNIGTPVGGVTTDINAAPRSATTPDAGAIEFVGIAADMAVTNVTIASAGCSSTIDTLKVTLRNVFGSTVNFSLNPVEIKWRILGPVSDSGSYLISFGTLATAQDTEFVVSSTINRSVFGTYNVLVYIDSNAINNRLVNDTVSFQVKPALNGLLTVGPSMTHTFNSLKDAIENLENSGVCGPVELVVTPGFNTNDNLIIGNIPGASAINTVRIRGNNTTIQSAISPVIQMSGTEYLTIDSFNIVASLENGYVVYLSNNTQFVKIRYNTINAGLNTSGVTSGGIVAAGNTVNLTTAGNNANNITIENNIIIGGNYNIALNGSGSYLGSSGHVIRNNRLQNGFAGGIYLSSTDTVIIENNNISRASRPTVGQFNGINAVTTRNTKVVANSIHSTGAGSYTCYPIWFATSINSVGFETEIINNTIYNIPTTGLYYAMHFTASTTGFKIYHNTISMDLLGSTGAIRGINFGVAPNNVDFRNNILSITGSGTGIKHHIFMTGTPTTFTANRNVYHMNVSGGTNNVGNWSIAQATLANWQAASSQDANSTTSNPAFADLSAGNLMPLSSNIDNLGSPVGVTTDILGVTRSITTPDAGAYEFTGLAGDIALTSAGLSRSSICYNTNDTVHVRVRNLIGSTVDFVIDPLTIVYQVNGPVTTVDSIIVFSGVLPVDSSLSLFATNVNMSAPGHYTLTAYIRPNAVNLSSINDTLTDINITVDPILSVSPRTATAVSSLDSFQLEANSPFFSSGEVKFTEICHWRGATGAAPIGGWPAYLIADDYVELIGLPNFDIAGYTLEVWTASALQHSVTFPTGTVFSPWGTMIIATGQLGSSVPSPANFYYHSGNTTSYGSTTAQGYIIKNAQGIIIDAVIYGAITFPVAAGVSAADWNGSTPAVSSAGNRLIGPDLNNGTNWITENASNRQDPNTFNAGVPAIIPTVSSGITWSYLGTPFDTNRTTVVGPYTIPGTYQYVATFTNTCGTFYDTVTITAASTVPVTLSKLEATKRINNVVISWSTASEVNNSHFVVERSIDGIHFEGIGRVRGNGTTSRMINYSFTDEGVLDQYARVNTIYYRLRQVDFDGSEELSRVLRVQNEQSRGVQTEILPNPNRGSFVLALSTDWENEANITIYNTTGTMVYNKQTMLQNGTNRMDMNLDLPSGVYSIIVNHQGLQTIKRFVIE